MRINRLPTFSEMQYVLKPGDEIVTAEYGKLTVTQEGGVHTKHDNCVIAMDIKVRDEEGKRHLLIVKNDGQSDMRSDLSQESEPIPHRPHTRSRSCKTVP